MGKVTTIKEIDIFDIKIFYFKKFLEKFFKDTTTKTKDNKDLAVFAEGKEILYGEFFDNSYTYFFQDFCLKNEEVCIVHKNNSLTILFFKDKKNHKINNFCENVLK